MTTTTDPITLTIQARATDKGAEVVVIRPYGAGQQKEIGRITSAGAPEDLAKNDGVQRLISKAIAWQPTVR